jgi:hypothetical protein
LLLILQGFLLGSDGVTIHTVNDLLALSISMSPPSKLQEVSDLQFKESMGLRCP